MNFTHTNAIVHNAVSMRFPRYESHVARYGRKLYTAMGNGDNKWARIVRGVLCLLLMLERSVKHPFFGQMVATAKVCFPSEGMTKKVRCLFNYLRGRIRVRFTMKFMQNYVSIKYNKYTYPAAILSAFLDGGIFGEDRSPRRS